MAKLIIVCGLPGSGKTTLAGELSKRLKLPCIHKDAIKEKLFESLNLSSLEDSKKIGKPAVDVMMHLAEQQLVSGVDLIIEAPFNFPEDYPIFERWQKDYNLDVFSVICSIDKDTRKYRYDNRERHFAHFDADRACGHFKENEFDYASIPGKQIRIKTEKPVNILVQEILPNFI